jgi:hypothetical protein
LGVLLLVLAPQRLFRATRTSRASRSLPTRPRGPARDTRP